MRRENNWGFNEKDHRAARAAARCGTCAILRRGDVRRRAIGKNEVSSAAAVSESDAKGLYVGPLFETYIERFRLKARAGMFAWKSDITLTSGGVAARDKDDGLDPYAGVGVSYAMTDNAFFGLSWTRFRVLDEIDIDAWDIRLKFAF